MAREFTSGVAITAGGLLIPAAAGSGKVLTSDASGNATWQTPTGGGGSPSLVSTLPVSPTDGQEIHFQNSTLAALGIVWAFRYRTASGSPYKWEFIGGPEWYAALGTGSVSSSGQGTAFFAETTNANNAFLTPFAGVFKCVSSSGFVNNNTGSTYSEIGPSLTGSATAADMASFFFATPNVGQGFALYKEAVLTATSGQNLRTVYHVTGGVGEWHRRNFSVVPIRVG